MTTCRCTFFHHGAAAFFYHYIDNQTIKIDYDAFLDGIGIIIKPYIDNFSHFLKNPQTFIHNYYFSVDKFVDFCENIPESV